MFDDIGKDELTFFTSYPSRIRCALEKRLPNCGMSMKAKRTSVVNVNLLCRINNAGVYLWYKYIYNYTSITRLYTLDFDHSEKMIQRTHNKTGVKDIPSGDYDKIVQVSSCFRLVTSTCFISPRTRNDEVEIRIMPH